MSKIWCFMIIISIIACFFTGTLSNITNIIMDSAKGTIDNMLTLIGMMCFWSGLFNVLEHTSLIDKFSKLVRPMINLLFKKKELTDDAVNYMSMNIATNVIGVGNASTVNGIKAMEEMQKVNEDKETASDNMTTFVLINTASIQLIPTSMIALKSLYGSNSPTDIVLPVIIVTFTSLIAGMIAIKILNKRDKKKARKC